MAAEQPRTPPPDAGGPTFDRRTFLKGAGLTAGAAAIGANPRVSPIGESEAFAPLVAAGVVGAAAVGAGMGWIARDIDPLNQDPAPEGLTPDALKQQVYQSGLKRESNNASTFVDNRNVINYMPEAAFTDAKKAAMQAMDEGKSESEVVSAGEQAANAHFVTVEKNFLDSWNETVNEFAATRATVESHADVTASNVLTPYARSTGTDYVPNTSENISLQGTSNVGSTTKSITLRDGSTYDLQSVSFDGDFAKADTWTATVTYDPLGYTYDGNYSWSHLENLAIEATGLDGSVIYGGYQDWNAVWSDLQTVCDQVISDLNTWVSNTYGQVQTGEIDIANLITAGDIASTKDVPQAIADLVAANIPADLDNQITVEMGQHTLSGFIATTDQNALSEVAPGDTIDPNATDDSGNPVYGTIYLAQDPVEWRFDWQAYDDSKGVDGGLVWFTRNPAEIDGMQSNDLIHEITTGAGETATVTPSDFSETTDGSGNPVWEVDLSDQLENQITTIDTITTGANVDESNYSVTILDETFTVTSTESGDPITIDQNREPQDDSNYITQDEWDQLLQQQKDLIDKYEEAQNDPVFGGGLFSDTSIPTLPGLGVVESGVVVLLGILGLNVATS